MSNETKKALKSLITEVGTNEKRTIISFDHFLEEARIEPQRIFRNIFQLFHDMVRTYVKEGKDEYPDDPESIGFIEYNCSNLFVKNLDNPFFTDRLFANRFVRQMESLRRGSQQNRIYVFVGPPGCGKSIFLNNLLQKFEEYTETKEGRCFEVFWEIDENLFPFNKGKSADSKFQKFEVSCPSHDHPILIIPKKYRPDFLNELFSEKMTEVEYRIMSEKEYDRIFKEEACTICQSLFWALFDKLGSLDKVLEMVKVRSYQFNRRLGDGISVFNPGDKPIREAYFTDNQIQEKLDRVFGANLVKYVFSRHAKTNNGIYVLMDIKSHNKERLLELHNIISEGVHKVDAIEEKINSLFFALMNPEDKKEIEQKGEASFQARIQYSKILYVLNASTEVKIYRRILGEHIDLHFLPRVLENFAKVIIASRMKNECNALKEWIKDVGKYKKYCDEKGLLLRMSIYNGVIPIWLSEEDKKNFTASIRKKIIVEAENEGECGVSGRDSIKLFDDFFSRYGLKPNLITMDNVVDFFNNKINKGELGKDREYLRGFIASLVDLYDYNVLNAMKEALYFYNKNQISADILNYIYAVNCDLGNKVICPFTGEKIEITTEFLKLIGSYIRGRQLGDFDAVAFAKATQQAYVQILAQDPNVKIVETELYKDFFDAYVRNLKEKVLQPFIKNESFHEAVKYYGAKEFVTFDSRLKEHIVYMIDTLVSKFGYTEQGAKEICLYVIEKKIADKF